MIRYDLYSAPSATGDNKKTFARPICTSAIDTEQLINQICINEGFIDTAEARKQLQTLIPFLSKNAACTYLTRATERGFLRNVASKSNPVYMKA